MSLIESGKNIGQGELTLEQKKERVKKRIERKTYETYAGLIGAYNDLYKMVWQNPQGLTPQQVFDSLGTNAAELFELSALLVQTVNTAEPDTISVSHPYQYIVNQDGTVTVGDPVE